MTDSFWKKCNTCKKAIPFKTLYWVCNVSTCNRKRTGLNFCSVSCWDAHVPMMRHRESWAEERRSPSEEEWQRIQSGEEDSPRERAPRTPKTDAAAVQATSETPSPAPIIRRRSTQNGN